MPLPLIPIISNLARKMGGSAVGEAVGGLARGAAEGNVKGAAGNIVAGLGPKHTKILKAGAFATGALTKSMNQLNSSLKNFMQVNERLAVVNSNFGKESSKNADALRGAEQGFGLAAKAITEFRVLGFKDSSKGMIDLSTRMKISGQDTGKMMKTFQGLLGPGGVNEKNLGNLAQTITHTSLKYNTTTDSLIGALDKLSANLLDLNITGGAETTANATVALAGMVGPQLDAQAGRFMALLTSMDMKTVDQSVILGLGPFADKLTQGIAVSNAEMTSAIRQASRNVKSIVGESGNVSRRALAAQKGVIGELGIIAVSLSDGIGKQTEVANTVGSVIDSIKGTFEHLKATFLAPFQIALAEMSPAFKTMTKSLFMIGGAFLNLIGAFSPVISFVFDIISLVARVIAFIVQAIATIVDMVMVVVKPISKVWEFVTGRGDESVGDTKLDFGKVVADFKSLGQTMGIESSTTEIVESNKSLSNTYSNTSQRYITHSNNLTKAVTSNTASNTSVVNTNNNINKAVTSNTTSNTTPVVNTNNNLNKSVTSSKAQNTSKSSTNNISTTLNNSVFKPFKAVLQKVIAAANVSTTSKSSTNTNNTKLSNFMVAPLEEAIKSTLAAANVSTTFNSNSSANNNISNLGGITSQQNVTNTNNTKLSNFMVAPLAEAIKSTLAAANTSTTFNSNSSANNNISNLGGLTSQQTITKSSMSASLSTNAATINRAAKILSRKKSSTSTLMTAAVLNINNSVKTIAQLEEEAKAARIVQDLSSIKSSNDDIDNRLFYIADMAAREANGTYMQLLLQQQNGILSNIATSNNQVAGNTIPQPRVTQANAPSGGHGQRAIY
jgi:hypothetical protein